MGTAAPAFNVLKPALNGDEWNEIKNAYYFPDRLALESCFTLAARAMEVSPLCDDPEAHDADGHCYVQILP